MITWTSIQLETAIRNNMTLKLNIKITIRTYVREAKKILLMYKEVIYQIVTCRMIIKSGKQLVRELDLLRKNPLFQTLRRQLLIIKGGKI